MNKSPMQITALKDLFKATGKTVARFPFVVICATVATAVAVVALGLHQDNMALHDKLGRAIMALYLGMLAGISCTVYCEMHKVKTGIQFLLNFLLVLLMYYYYYVLPDKLLYIDFSRFALFLIAFHSLLAFAPFLIASPPNGFWQYNKQLFLRFLTAAFYSNVLFLGLALALLAIDNLFVVHIDNAVYGKLYIVVMGIFNTLFFLSGIPEDVASLDNNNDYPKGLKIFTQFILLPLVTLYLLILYAYALKIIFTSTWPEGWVSYLVIGFSIAGILAFLLVWPLRNNEKHQWIRPYTKYFFFALLPLMGMLFTAIGKRVMQYGITENRFFILVLAIWLLVVDFYFLMSKVKNIKMIPLTLFLFCIFSAYGPWSAFSVSEKSQFKRLKNLLEQNHHLQNGKAVRSSFKLPPQTARAISSASSYLINTHGLQSIQPLFSINLDSLCLVTNSSDIYIFRTGKVLSSIGIDYSNPDDFGPSYGSQVNLNVKNDNVIITKDFQYVISFNISGGKLNQQNIQVFRLQDDSVSIEWIDSISAIQLLYNNAFPVTLNILSIIDSLSRQSGLQLYDIHPDKMQFNLENGKIRYRLHINTINASLTEHTHGMELYNLSGQLLTSSN